MDKEYTYGECYHMQKSPSKYKIRLDNDSNVVSLIETLAHEFVHVRQFDSKELVFFSNCSRWLGKYYSDDAFDETEQPWEVEPREREAPLAAEFFAQ